MTVAKQLQTMTKCVKLCVKGCDFFEANFGSDVLFVTVFKCVKGLLGLGQVCC